MAKGFWLVKTEPEVYSIDDLRRDRVTDWDRVRNHQAKLSLRDGMRDGDRVLVYHSNADPAGIAGIAEVVGEAIADPTQFDARSEYHDPKSTPAAPRWMMRRMRFVERFARVVTLDELRADAASASMMALRPGNRLSVTPVSAAEFRAACRLAKRAVAR